MHGNYAETTLAIMLEQDSLWAGGILTYGGVSGGRRGKFYRDTG